MSAPQKKTIPKFKKKLQGFLSDESGKITKEDVLKMGMVAMGVGGVGQVEAGYNHSNNNSPGSPPSNGHANGGGGWCYGQGAWSWGNIVNGHASGSGVAGGWCYGGTATHVNITHSNHGSHGSHGSHGAW